MKQGYSGIRVRGVSLENGEPIVILEDRATDRRLCLPVGPYEASAIILELECISTPRPLAHDLLAYFFMEGGFCLDEVAISGEDGSETRARLAYHRGLRKYEKEVRPADALALALRLDVPVLAESALFARQGENSAAWHRPRIIPLGEWKAKARAGEA
jgi:uncharacterized protein